MIDSVSLRPLHSTDVCFTYSDAQYTSLRRLTANHDPAFFTVFPLHTKQERDRFDLLRQAYVGARYHDDYKITPQELKYLARCVELLREQVEKSCQEKMETLA